MKNVLLVSGNPTTETTTNSYKVIHGVQQVLSHEDFTVAAVPVTQYEVNTHQDLLEWSDIVVFQFPLYWSTFPSVMHSWVESIFTEEWAFGTEASALKGKKFIFSITAGAKEDSYQEGGFNHLPIEHYLESMKSVFLSSKMEYADSVITFEVHNKGVEGHIEKLAEVLNKIK